MARARDHGLLIGLLAFAAALFTYRWLFENNRPHDGSLGWHAFHDQGLYYQEAELLARLKPIPAAIFVPGPGYPVLAAPFSRIGPLGWPSGDPFFFADLGIWLLAVAATFLVARRLHGDWFGLAAALAVVLATPLAAHVVTPSNTNVSLAAISVAMLVALAPELRWWHGAVLGIAITFAYAARYVDALWITIAVAGVVAAKRASSRLDVVLGLGAAAYLTALPFLYLNWHAFGNPFATSYREVAANQISSEDFSLSSVIPHALQGFVSPFYFADSGFRELETEPMLASMFLVAAAPVGLVWTYLAGGRGRRTLVLTFALASVAGTLFYLAYFFTGSYGIHYGAFHYYNMWWPLWTIAGAAGIFHVAQWLRLRSPP